MVFVPTINLYAASENPKGIHMRPILAYTYFNMTPIPAYTSKGMHIWYFIVSQIGPLKKYVEIIINKFSEINIK